MTIPRNAVRVTSRRTWGALLHYWHCRSCDWVSPAFVSWISVGTHAHQHARECRDAS